MRKFTFLLGVVMMTSSLAYATLNYTAELDGTYTYIGTPVEELSVDFATWFESDLLSTLSDDMTLQEAHNLGIIKWKIASRSCGGKGTVNALFNNDYGDFSEGGAEVRNDKTSNKPRIFLPTTVCGVKSIKISGYVSGSYNQPIVVYYKDASQTTWKWKGSLTLSTTYGEVSLELNTVGQTSLYLVYDKTPYISISDLELDIETPLYSYNESTSKYDYIGEPVESLSVDFTTWSTSYLPTKLSDDMPLVQKNGLGFVKWKIQKRTCGDRGEVYTLFNNNNGDFPSGAANTSSTNKPRIYLPTTSTGVTNIKVHGLGNVSIGVFYKDVNHATWTYHGGISLPTSYDEVNYPMSTNGKTSIYLEYANTPYPVITDLQVETKYKLNTTTNLYEYQGAPVDEIDVDFTSWYAGYLPSELSDDMPLAEMRNLGFVKWKIKQHDGMYYLFNNNIEDPGVTIANNAAANKPTIYFPTTVRGVESIAITYGVGSDVTIDGTYTDDVQTKTKAIELPASTDYDNLNTVVWNLNSSGQTSVYLKYGYTAWPRIKRIVFTLKDTENTPLGLWDRTSDTDNDTKLEEANGEVRDVYLNRSFVADGGYYTLCLPFDLTAGQVASAFGDCKLAKLSSSEMRGTLVHLTFDYVNAIEAGVPYLFLPSADIADCAFPGVTINTDASKTINTTYFSMTGIYSPQALTSDDYYMGEDNYLLPVTSDEPLRPFRSYFTVIEPVPMGVRARVMFAPEHATDIEFVQSDNIPYTKELRNGHLYIRRGETVYTLSGQIVK